jgi:hypothetical protein
MKNLILGSVVAVLVGACAYSGVATDGGKAVVLRNDSFLFGMLRKAYVCQVTDAGLTNCNSADAP